MEGCWTGMLTQGLEENEFLVGVGGVCALQKGNIVSTKCKHLTRSRKRNHRHLKSYLGADKSNKGILLAYLKKYVGEFMTKTTKSRRFLLKQFKEFLD
ncbi:unnamed protein product [Dovyalis caffra]|uniref:Uncharacterized protein n=1 Tax=Dovyalis caffra TaxID=77055 RepID=A0AAV1RSZ5_9ROSI|nr:unnamed protein product [Dovyalis caffra]